MLNCCRGRASILQCAIAVLHAGGSDSLVADKVRVVSSGPNGRPNPRVALVDHFAIHANPAKYLTITNRVKGSSTA